MSSAARAARCGPGLAAVLRGELEPLQLLFPGGSTETLERIYRDARCGSLMLPWTAELCLDRLGRETLYEPGESDE